MIEDSHDGKVNDSRFGVRMRGEGNYAAIIAQQYKKYRKLYNLEDDRWELYSGRFMRPGEQITLF
jgi:hypothetical protein